MTTQGERDDIVIRLDRELSAARWNKDEDGRLPIWPEWLQEARDEIVSLRAARLVQ